MIEITPQKINLEKVLQEVQHPEAGAVDIFIGTVRNQTEKKKVVRLEYEAHTRMAISEIKKIAEQASEKWPVKSFAVVHRIGILTVGEIAVALAVATPHRKDAFEACRFMIDTIKKTVPIWKKEIYEDGETWVAAHP